MIKNPDLVRVLFWILLLFNNLIGATLLGFTFLTGPAYDTPFWKVFWGLTSYVSIVSLVFSIITVALLAMFRSLHPTIKYLKAFAFQFGLFIGGYLLVYVFIFLRFGL